MEIINRQIEQRQLEIQSLAQQKAMELNEEQATRIFENITVPHDLSEILSKIKTSETKPMEIDDDDDEYVPAPMGNVEYRSKSSTSYSSANQQTPIVNSMMDVDERVQLFQAIPPAPMIGNVPVDNQPSRLANMTDADLMKLVPDGALTPPPAPIISQPIPGLDDDDFEMN